ncbi:TetR/AcrR family transcriptional regulator [Paracoccus sp. (in: a-proteobacteria)]|uniref:TetR/AcrR family transcriptional regulator n=1 Tax=Paracoccus sp. TaxID=267 RepID=UPI0032206528
MDNLYRRKICHIFHCNPSRVKITVMSPLKAGATARKTAPRSRKTPVKVDAAAPRKRAAATVPASEPKPYHHGNLRETLLAAADGVLARHGAAGITLRDVAKAAGVSHAAPYHHFASLDEMLAAVAERGFARLAAAMAAHADESDPRERLLQICEAYVDCARTHPAQFRLMFGALLARKHEFPTLKAAADGAFAQLLAASTGLDAERGPDVALLGWSLAHGLSNLLIDGAFDGLPMELPAGPTLARRLAALALGGALRQASRRRLPAQSEANPR